MTKMDRVKKANQIYIVWLAPMRALLLLLRDVDCRLGVIVLALIGVVVEVRN